MKLIVEESREVNKVTNHTDKTLYLEGVWASAEVENNNKRTYEKRTLEREVDKYQDKIDKKISFGQINHPTSLETYIRKIAIITETLKWEDNNLMGRARVLSTPSGEILKSLLLDDTNVGISSRGTGEVDDNGIVEHEQYRLITFDCVTEASNPESLIVNGILEGVTFSPCEVREALLIESSLLEELETRQWGGYHFFYMGNVNSIDGLYIDIEKKRQLVRSHMECHLVHEDIYESIKLLHKGTNMEQPHFRVMDVFHKEFNKECV